MLSNRILSGKHFVKLFTMKRWNQNHASFNSKISDANGKERGAGSEPFRDATASFRLAGRVQPEKRESGEADEGGEGGSQFGDLMPKD